MIIQIKFKNKQTIGAKHIAYQERRDSIIITSHFISDSFRPENMEKKRLIVYG